MGGDYEFLTEWRVAGTIDEVKAVLGDGPSLPRWWPSVYLSVNVIEKGGEGGEGPSSTSTPRAGPRTPCAGSYTSPSR